MRHYFSRRAVCVSCILINCIILCFGRSLTSAAPSAQGDADIESTLNTFLTTLRSDVLKTEAITQAQHLMNKRDIIAAEASVDFFYDMRAKDILSYALAKRSGNYDLRAYIAAALEEIVQTRDIEVARVALSQLQTTSALAVVGGTEEQIAHTKYQVALIRLLEKVVGEPLLTRELEATLPAHPPEKNLIDKVDLVVRAWIKRMESQ